MLSKAVFAAESHKVLLARPATQVPMQLTDSTLNQQVFSECLKANQSE